LNRQFNQLDPTFAQHPYSKDVLASLQAQGYPSFPPELFAQFDEVQEVNVVERGVLMNHPVNVGIDFLSQTDPKSRFEVRAPTNKCYTHIVWSSLTLAGVAQSYVATNQLLTNVQYNYPKPCSQHPPYSSHCLVAGHVLPRRLAYPCGEYVSVREKLFVVVPNNLLGNNIDSQTKFFVVYGHVQHIMLTMLNIHVFCVRRDMVVGKGFPLCPPRGKEHVAYPLSFFYGLSYEWFLRLRRGTATTVVTKFGCNIR